MLPCQYNIILPASADCMYRIFNSEPLCFVVNFAVSHSKESAVVVRDKLPDYRMSCHVKCPDCRKKMWDLLHCWCCLANPSF